MQSSRSKIHEIKHSRILKMSSCGRLGDRMQPTGGGVRVPGGGFLEQRLQRGAFPKPPSIQEVDVLEAQVGDERMCFPVCVYELSGGF